MRAMISPDGREEQHLRLTSPKGLVGLIALAGCAVVALAAPERAAACSGPGLTFADVVAQSELIVEGRVTQSLLTGLAYDLDVQEVFKGSLEGPTVRIGPVGDSLGRGCEVFLEVGAHVILGVIDVDAQLSALSTAVWHVALDGSLSSTGSYYLMAANADDLRAKLRDALPDTSVPPIDGPDWRQAGTALVALAGLVSIWRLGSRVTPAASKP